MKGENKMNKIRIKMIKILTIKIRKEKKLIITKTIIQMRIIKKIFN